MTLYVFWNDCQKVVKSLLQTFSNHSVKMSSNTSFSDHCNSIPMQFPELQGIEF